MDTTWTAGLTLLASVLFVCMSTSISADDSKKDDPYKIPDINAKEWKAHGDKGLKIWDVKEGSGEAAKVRGTVTVHYTGWTLDGKVFDSSKKRNQSITFSLDILIEGWKEGIPGMKPGGIRRLYIPYTMGYGETGKAGLIAPRSDLVFEIEMLEDPFKLPDLKSKEWKPLGDTPIKYWDVKDGTGDTVKASDTVTIHYTGWTLDGKVFDSSKKGGGQPATFPLNSLIKGWQEGVPGMKVGGVRRLLIPHEFAYGENGSPPSIPPKATLVFEIEVKGMGR